ncbi:MAG TPA: hypothetical protein VHQ43_04400 [Solirubrobacterales bacterium]|jgi:predicted nucleic acid-binding protein|nr:hypothetical protein [Solirubrobacterales bacterium]
MAVIVAEAGALGANLLVPAAALAQTWRGGPRSARLARLLNGSEIDPLDERRAREVGVRLGARGAVDVADAQVVCTAVEHGAAVATSNPNDIANLLRTGETLDIVPV